MATDGRISNVMANTFVPQIRDSPSSCFSIDQILWLKSWLGALKRHRFLNHSTWISVNEVIESFLGIESQTPLKTCNSPGANRCTLFYGFVKYRLYPWNCWASFYVYTSSIHQVPSLVKDLLKTNDVYGGIFTLSPPTTDPVCRLHWQPHQSVASHYWNRIKVSWDSCLQ